MACVSISFRQIGIHSAFTMNGMETLQRKTAARALVGVHSNNPTAREQRLRTPSLHSLVCFASSSKSWPREDLPDLIEVHLPKRVSVSRQSLCLHAHDATTSSRRLWWQWLYSGWGHGLFQRVRWSNRFRLSGLNSLLLRFFMSRSQDSERRSAVWFSIHFPKLFTMYFKAFVVLLN